MVKPIRRVVTGHDADGKAVIIMDSDATNIVTSEHRPGGRTNLWRTTSMPACYGGDKDEADAQFDVEPPANGVNFRISRIPTGETPKSWPSSMAQKPLAKLVLPTVLFRVPATRSSHRTETVDYGIVAGRRDRHAHG